MATREEFEQAVRDFGVADGLEKRAKVLRDAARKVVLDYYGECPDAFSLEPTATQSRLFCLDGGGVRVTQTTTKGQPSRPDPDRVEQAYDDALRSQNVSTAVLFRLRPEWLDAAVIIRAIDGLPTPEKLATAEFLRAYMLPATEDAPGPYRVTAVKG